MGSYCQTTCSAGCYTTCYSSCGSSCVNSGCTSTCYDGCSSNCGSKTCTALVTGTSPSEAKGTSDPVDSKPAIWGTNGNTGTWVEGSTDNGSGK